jgi:hypothetical protein
MITEKITTIGFFGDSFCNKESNQHSDENNYETYIRQLLRAKGYELVNLGMGGSSVWDLYLNQLKPCIDSNSIPDISVFAWTNSGRLFHRIARSLNHTSALAGHNKKKEADFKKLFPNQANFFDKDVWDAAKQFYLYLYDSEKEDIEYVAFLQYLDNNVFNKWPENKKIIHLWSFGEWDFIKQYNVNDITYVHRWVNGVEIRPPLMSLSAKLPTYPILDDRPNHISGQENNKLISDAIISGIDNYQSGNLIYISYSL